MKKEMTPMLLWLMQSFLQKYPRSNEVRVESWIESDNKTMRVMVEVRINKRVPYAPSLS